MMGVPDFKGGETKPRHHIHMRVPPRPKEAPREVVSMINRPLANMGSALRTYGNPNLLRAVASINGADFTPFQEYLFHKPAGLGTSTAWHQDPSSAWDEEWSKPGFDYGTCGCSFHLSLYQCTPANGLWVVPGSHKAGRVDVKALSQQSGGTDRLLGAVPVLCKPGDIFIHNRLALHGAFPNTSSEPRATLIMGFHRRASVIGKRISGSFGAGKPRVYDEAWIEERSRMVQFAIDARQQRYPGETPYAYLPFRGREAEHQYREEQLKQDRSFMNYRQKDIVI